MSNPGDPLFPEQYKASGILLHVTSLPSPYGVGDFGPTALKWIDTLADAGQSYWQILPIAPTGHGNSPYGPLSSFAANPLLVSPDLLIRDGLVSESGFAVNFTEHQVDYGGVASFKQMLLDVAWKNFRDGTNSELKEAYDRFCHEQQHWVSDYGLFVALKANFGGKELLSWPVEYLRREHDAIERARAEFSEQIDRVQFEQFVLFRQWNELKAHAASRGIKLIGDLPIFVSSDSSDVWSTPEIFLLNENSRPTVVAGVPPDYFSKEGQFWGNPLYDWAKVKATDYRWWMSRLRATLEQVDIVRLDHFRAFAAAWHVAADAENAINGKWVPGPGGDFFEVARREFDGLPFIAEDLGLITDDVRELLKQFNLPGMRVLQFAFEDTEENPFLPQNFDHNTVAYTGTHDNDTTRGWYQSLEHHQREKVWQMLGRDMVDEPHAVHTMIDILWHSKAALVVIPLQDLLNYGSDARMNVPGVAEGNWQWRCTESMLEHAPFEFLAALTERTNRSARAEQPA